MNANRQAWSRPLFLLPAALLGGILILATIVTGRGEREQRGTTAVKNGIIAGGPAVPPQPLNQPARVRESLPVNSVYRILLKGALTARVEDTDWGIRKIVNLAYASEAIVERVIEQNDGCRLVETRRFKAIRNTKLLSDVEDVTIELGEPGEVILSILGSVDPGAALGLDVAKSLAETVLRLPANALAAEQLRAFSSVDDLSGKTVRLTYIDGQGVTAIEPIDCSLTTSQQQFLFATACLSDCYLLPDVHVKPGEGIEVDGSQIAVFLDPSWRGVPEGSVVVLREEDAADPGPKLSIKDGFVQIKASDDSTRRIGSLTPRGEIAYVEGGSHIQEARLTGDATLEQISQDHLLFEARFKTNPQIEIQYSCMRTR